jgi:hypothetical protein
LLVDFIKPRIQESAKVWEHPDFDPSEDKFMQRFDENGNFVNIPKLKKMQN